MCHADAMTVLTSLIPTEAYPTEGTSNILQPGQCPAVGICLGLDPALQVHEEGAVAHELADYPPGLLPRHFNVVSLLVLRFPLFLSIPINSQDSSAIGAIQGTRVRDDSAGLMH